MILTANDLRFVRPGGFALHVPRWEVDPGSRVALRGPSGAGKSTLLSLVAGELAATAGELRVLGLDLHRAGDGARRAHRIQRIGWVFQDFPLVPHLDALDNVLLPYRVAPGLRLTDTVRRRAAALLGDLGLGALTRRLPPRLSQGERQRVAIARALVTEPALILADEPTAGLDPDRSAQLLDLLEGLVAARGATLLLVSHDPSVLARFDRIVDVDAFREQP